MVERPHSGGAQRGATYIEVLVASVLLAFGLLALCNMFVLGYASVGKAGKTTAGVSAARQVLEDVKLLPFDNIVNLNGFDTDNPATLPASDPERELAKRWRFALAGESSTWTFASAEKTRWTNLGIQGGTLGGVGRIAVVQPSTTLREVAVTVVLPGRFRDIRISTLVARM